MTATDTNLERWEMVAMAVAEIDPTIWIGPPRDSRFGSMSNAGADQKVSARAHRLVQLSRFGPDRPAVCDDHRLPDRPDLWEKCLKVRVMDALNGLTCDTHGLLNSQAAA